MNTKHFTTDFLIIGSGAAGLYAALHASRYGSVQLVTKSSLKTSSSYWAQGGIAAVIDESDNFDSHISDTLAAGREFCDREAVDVLVREGAREVRQLISLGMPFDQVDGKPDLGLEGGHSQRRVLHADGAATGRTLVNFLSKRVANRKNISVIEEAFVCRLISDGDACSGAIVYVHGKSQLLKMQSSSTILATGGYSGIYNRSTNPHTSIGDGLWLAYQAGATLQDLEFVQFHPTVFCGDDGTSFLISEALRGEGAQLFNVKGKRFMAAYPGQELAPRDVVSREILKQIQQQEQAYVHLRVNHLDISKLRHHFPHLIKRIEDQGIDISREGIPVAPAAHYSIGGVATGLDSQTSIKGLYACGEVAATGVHGANRLASNSLLECLVFGRRAAEHAAQTDNNYPSAAEVFPAFYVNTDRKDDFVMVQNEVATQMSQNVSISRNREGLQNALDGLASIRTQADADSQEYYGMRILGLVQIAEMIISSALKREESRGVHFRKDFPDIAPTAKHLSFSNQKSYTLAK